MNSKDIRGLTAISIADGTHVGTIDQGYLDLAAKQVVGFSITNGGGPFGGARDNAPTVAASGVHALGPDALTLDDVAAAHAAWVGAAYGPLESLDDVVGRKVVTDGCSHAEEYPGRAARMRICDPIASASGPRNLFEAASWNPFQELLTTCWALNACMRTSRAEGDCAQRASR